MQDFSSSSPDNSTLNNLFVPRLMKPSGRNRKNPAVSRVSFCGVINKTASSYFRARTLLWCVFENENMISRVKTLISLILCAHYTLDVVCLCNFANFSKRDARSVFRRFLCAPRMLNFRYNCRQRAHVEMMRSFDETTDRGHGTLSLPNYVLS